jgi:hypothetical protein
MMPVFFLWGYVGVAELVKPKASKRYRRILSQVWILLIPMIAMAVWSSGAQAYARDVAFISSEMVVTAEWVNLNIQEDEVIAAHDIGALGYFAQHPILDLAGLVSPEVIPFIRDEVKLKAFLDEHHPKYLITFPGWYPDLVKDLPMVYKTDGEFSQAPEGENMSVYKWSTKPK